MSYIQVIHLHRIEIILDTTLTTIQGGRRLRLPKVGILSYEKMVTIQFRNDFHALLGRYTIGSGQRQMF